MGMAALVNAASGRTLDDLIKEARASGEATTANSDEAKFGGIPEGTPGKTLELEETVSSDGMAHDLTVYFKDDKPICVLFTAITEKTRSEEFLNLSCDAKGKLSLCYRAVGTKDDKGQPIPRTVKFTSFGRKDRQMKEALRHELDFWLKGKYRKPTAAKR